MSRSKCFGALAAEMGEKMISLRVERQLRRGWVLRPSAQVQNAEAKAVFPPRLAAWAAFGAGLEWTYQLRV